MYFVQRSLYFRMIRYNYPLLHEGPWSTTQFLFTCNLKCLFRGWGLKKSVRPLANNNNNKNSTFA